MLQEVADSFPLPLSGAEYPGTRFSCPPRALPHPFGLQGLQSCSSQHRWQPPSLALAGTGLLLLIFFPCQSVTLTSKCQMTPHGKFFFFFFFFKSFFFSFFFFLPGACNLIASAKWWDQCEGFRENVSLANSISWHLCLLAWRALRVPGRLVLSRGGQGSSPSLPGSPFLLQEQEILPS